MASVTKRDGWLHIEVDGGIINIKEKLSDRRGRSVTAIEIIPDDRFSGEPVWRLSGRRNSRLVQLKTVVGGMSRKRKVRTVDMDKVEAINDRLGVVTPDAQGA